MGRLFDPDYSRPVWNRSRYSPKNSKRASMTTIGQLFGGISSLIILLITAVSPLGIFTAFVTFWIVAFCVAILIRRAEWRRLNPNDKELKHKLEVDAPKAPTFDDITDTRFMRPPDGVPAPYIAHSPEFEHEIAWLFNMLTTSKAVAGGKDGAEIKLYGRSGNLIGIVQCKKYDKTLPAIFVREIADVKKRFAVENAWLVTTGIFNEATRKEAKNLGIRLFDGNEVQKMRKKAKDKSLQI